VATGRHSYRWIIPPRTYPPGCATWESVWLIERPSPGLLRRPTPGEMVEDGRLGRPHGRARIRAHRGNPTCGYAAPSDFSPYVITTRIGLPGVPRNRRRGRPPSPWSGHKPGSASAAPPPAGPGGSRGSGVGDRRC